MRVLVTLRAADDADAFIEATRASGRAADLIPGLTRVVLCDGQGDLAALRSHPAVLAVEDADAPLRGAGSNSGTIGDDLSGFNWGLARIVRRSAPWNTGRIRTPFPTYFRSVRDGTGVDIYVIDSGLRETHAEITGRATNVYDYYSGAQAAHYHGTACASLAAGGTVGPARGALLWSFRCLDANNVATSLAVTTAMGQALSHYQGRSATGRPAVVNLSLSAAGTAHDAAAGDLIDAGMVVVAAAGNDQLDLDVESRTPAEATDVLCVGGLGMADLPYYSSGYGTSYGASVAVLAPAQDLQLADIDSDSDYRVASGTSYGCAMATGVVACMLQGHARLTTRAEVQAVRAKVIANATTGKFTAQSQWGIGTLPDKILYLDPDAASETFPPAPTFPPDADQVFRLDAFGASALHQDTAATTLADDPGEFVGRIFDASGHGLHGTQATSGNRPVVGRAPASRRNLIINSAFAGAASGTAGTTPTDWNRNFAITATTVVSADAAYGNKVRAQTTGGRILFSKLQPVMAALSTWCYSIMVDVVTPTTIAECFKAHNPPAGTTLTYKVNGVAQALTYTLPVGTGIKLEAVVAVGSTAGTIEAYWGCGIAAAVTADITFYAPQFEAGSARTDWQKTGVAPSFGTFPLDITEPAISGVQAGAAAIPYIRFDGTNDALSVTLSSTVTGGTMVVAGKDGIWVEGGVTNAAGTITFGGSAMTVPGSSIAGILKAVGDVVGVIYVNRAITTDERTAILAYYQAQGAGGLLEEGAELMPNVSAPDPADFTLSNVTGAQVSGQMRLTNTSATLAGLASKALTGLSGFAILRGSATRLNTTTATVSANGTGAFSGALGTAASGTSTGVQVTGAICVTIPGSGNVWVTAAMSLVSVAGHQADFDNISLKRLIPAALV